MNKSETKLSNELNSFDKIVREIYREGINNYTLRKLQSELRKNICTDNFFIAIEVKAEYIAMQVIKKNKEGLFTRFEVENIDIKVN